MAKKKKILLLSDDLRMFSGISTVSRELVMGTVDKYDWVQVGAALKNPDYGKILDLNDSVRKETGVEDANVKVIPFNGYGDQNLIRNLMMNERPDVILHFTDPRYWGWLYDMEHEIRQLCPLAYLNIWDSTPSPMYNAEAYASCDLLMAISKQTYAINIDVLTRKYPNDLHLTINGKSVNGKDNDGKPSTDITYVPHGIDPKKFYPIDAEHPDYEAFNQYRDKHFSKYDFVVFWNNRNINRKHPGDVVMAFKTFCDSLPKEVAERTLLLMHTAAVDQNGTDIPAIIREFTPNYNVMITADMLDTKMLNYLYNVADVTVNISSNEGFGLATAESVMAGTPIIVNVTGGLQDQCGFYFEDDTNVKYTSPDKYTEIRSLHDYAIASSPSKEKLEKMYGKLSHGNWVIPVFPASRTLNGSVPTPYIFDDHCNFEDVANAMMQFYLDGRDGRKQRGKNGREYFMRPDVGLNSESMCSMFAESIDRVIDTFTPKKPFAIYQA